ncbi:MAG: tRNA 2-thiouridine synthesizing protein B [Arenicella sp.]
MTTLFAINRSWHEGVWLFEQLAFAQTGDAIVLIEDAVLALQSPINLGSFLAKCAAQNIAVYALHDDCQLRGIDNKYPSVLMLDYSGYVDLVVQHDKQVAW